jgi:hypothetical protein
MILYLETEKYTLNFSFQISVANIFYFSLIKLEKRIL